MSSNEVTHKKIPSLVEDVTESPNRVWKKYKLNNQTTICGYSRAADRTFFHLPEMRMSLDAGGCRGRQPDFVFVTHAHNDHSMDVWYMAL
jgi:ribonuclease Z